ncbi:MAG: hypothetical protein OEY18_15885 [Candidatus Aminicenantes bacterium]|nr:hypothetical protein [Candidatus Aminicenantes bacterium]MDH5386180.1 hypothetical protein [Candidatus Aminicenantes bacterium]
MVIGTHGRGVWAMDVKYIQQCTSEFLAKPAHLFETGGAQLPAFRGRGIRHGYINYFLNKPQQVILSIKDESGQIIKRLEATDDLGLNRIVWNLTKDDGQFVAPGIYSIDLSAEAVKLEEKIKVKQAVRRR